MTHEFSQHSAEQLQPMAPGEMWQEAAQDPRLEESFLTDGMGVTLRPDQPIELPEAFDKIPPRHAKDPLAIVYAGSPRTADGQPQKSWERGTMFVVYGKSLASEKLHPDDPEGAVQKVGMRDMPRVYQVDTMQDVTSYAGSVHEGGLIVGRNTLSSEATPNNDMSRIHFTLTRTPEGNLSLVDHSKNGTAVLHAEQLSQTKEYTAAHDLGQTIVTSQIEQ